MQRPIRVLMAKAGLDGHDRGAKVIAKALRDAGMEVIYTGLRQTPAMIAQAAVQEDVDVVGVSILSGAHMTVLPAVIGELKRNGVGYIPVLVGGIIPSADAEELRKEGVAAVFFPGTPLRDIVTMVTQLAQIGKDNGLDAP